VIGAAAALAGATLGETRHAEAAGLPRCAAARPARTLPRALASFPLPRGSVVTSREERYGYAIFGGVVPGYLNPVRDALVSGAPAAGFRLTGGDAEAAEAEASFVGHGGRGRWRLRVVPGCAGALRLELAFRAVSGRTAR
jgi:hypothetical protein